MLHLRGDRFLEFLQERAAEIDRVPAADPAGLCILPGQIVRQNLQDRLDRENIPTATLADFTTIETLASDLLQTSGEPHQMLGNGLRRQLIAAACYELDPDQRLPEDVTIPNLNSNAAGLVSSQAEALEALADRLPYHEEEVQETIVDELDDYYRCTDATTEHGRLIDIITDSGFDGQFEQTHSLRSIRAFKAITTLIEDQLGSADDDRHISRSHLVHGARQVIEESWPARYDHVDWIAVAGISVFDNPTLRFLERLGELSDAPDVYLFADPGSFEYNKNRFEHLENASTSDTPELSDRFPNEGAQSLFDATQGDDADLPESVRLVEAASDRRLVEHIASDVRERVQAGADPGDFLIIAPNAGGYQALVRDAFRTVGIPIHIETRRPTANIPAYRFIRGLVQLVEKAERDARITYGELVDPLRLGYCNPSAQRSWPVDGRDFTTIEQRLHREQQRWHSGPESDPTVGLHLDDWEEIIDDIPNWTSDWNAVEVLLNDVRDRIDGPPTSGEELVSEFEPYLGSYVWETFDHRRQLFKGPGIDNTRVAMSETHVTSLARHVRREFESVGDLYEQSLALFDQTPSWGLAGEALSGGLGGDTYGENHLDGNAIPVVDAGNTYFRDAAHVYVLGMNAGEFPGERETPALLHEGLREEIASLATNGDAPYLHLDNDQTVYGESVDFYHASLAAANEEADITLLHSYRDQRGNEVSWSSFVDLLDTETESIRTRVGAYLPEPRDTSAWETSSTTDYDTDEEVGGGSTEEESWAELSLRISPRERLRSVLYHANRDYPSNHPEIEPADVEALLRDMDVETFEAAVEPRLERYEAPPTEVTISADEPAFDEVDLDRITGGPFHPHELDLVSQCGLKFYYYQLLYNYEGEAPDRETIPYYSSTQPHHRFYELPKVIRDNHADPRNVDRWKTIITDLLPDRQDPERGLRQFDSTDDLRAWFEEQDIDDFNDMLFENLRRERELVFNEVAADTTRDWAWREQTTIQIDDHELVVPPHRVDYVETESKTYAIPVFYARISNRARSALKACFDGDGADENIYGREDCASICEWCGKEDCQYDSKYVLDHRILGGYAQEVEVNDTSVLGIGIQEQWADDAGSRHLIIKSNHADKLHPDSTIEDLTKRGFSPQWYNEKVPGWETDLTTHADQLTTTDGVSLEANEDLVADDCLDCVYRDLCFVPEGGD